MRSVDQESGIGHGSKIDKFIETMEKHMQDLQREMKDMKQWKFQMQGKGNDTKHTKMLMKARKLLRLISESATRADLTSI